MAKLPEDIQNLLKRVDGQYPKFAEDAAYLYLQALVKCGDNQELVAEVQKHMAKKINNPQAFFDLAYHLLDNVGKYGGMSGERWYPEGVEAAVRSVLRDSLPALLEIKGQENNLQHYRRMRQFLEAGGSYPISIKGFLVDAPEGKGLIYHSMSILAYGVAIQSGNKTTFVVEQFRGTADELVKWSAQTHLGLTNKQADELLREWKANGGDLSREAAQAAVNKHNATPSFHGVDYFMDHLKMMGDARSAFANPAAARPTEQNSGSVPRAYGLN